MNRTLLMTVAALVPCCANQALAADEKDVNLAPVTVTSTKTEKVVTEAPASVSVITDKQIETKNATRIDEALAGTTGVFLNSSGGNGQPSNFANQITLRGMSLYSRTAVLVDGVSINDGFSQGVDTSLIPTDSIKQIEVVPGPFSSLYGGSAMGGVVNIITAAPTKREFILNAGYGSDNQYRSTATYRDKATSPSGSLGIVATLERDASDGYVEGLVNKTASGAGGAGAATGWQATQTSTGTKAYTLGDKGDVGWWNNNAGLKLIFDADDLGKLTSDFSYHDHSTVFTHSNYYLNGGSAPNTLSGGSYSLTGAGANITTKPGDYLNGPNGQESIRYNLGYEIKVWDDGVVKAHAGYMQDNYWYISPSSTAANDYGGAGTYSAVPSNKSSTDLQIGKPIGTQHYLIAGVSGELATLDKKVYLMNNWRNEDSQTRSLSQANGKTLTKSAYFQDEFTIINPLTLYVGARYDYWTTSGEVSEKAYSFSGTTYTAFDKVYSDRTSMAFSPKASLVYKLDDDTTLRTAWGKSFRTPSLSDMYSGFATATGFSYPNASLKPEKTRSFEVGGEHSFSTGTTIKATYFLTQVSNLIYSYNDNSGNTYKTNAGAEHIQGFEGEVRQKIVGAVYAFANLTNQSATITSNAAVPASVGHTATYAPRVLGNYGIQGDYQDYFGSLLIQHVGKIFNQANNSDSAANVFGANDSYTVVNTKIGWHITDEYTVTAAVGNLLDSKYFNSNAMPGRTFFFGVGAHF